MVCNQNILERRVGVSDQSFEISLKPRSCLRSRLESIGLENRRSDSILKIRSGSKLTKPQ